ncbi:MAG: hypothetical protein ACLPVY_10305 [Acidimicrobiia bacterium]
MLEDIEPEVEIARDTYRCPDCGTSIDVPAGTPTEILVAARGRPSLRLASVAGVEVHRCTSLFLTGPT